MSHIWQSKLKLLVLIVFLATYNLVFSQQKTITHKVADGDNLNNIAKRYNIQTEDIFELNPDARVALKLNSILIIPIVDKKSTNPKTHIAKKQETLFSIAKMYNLSVIDLERFNPEIKSEGLKIDQQVFLSEIKSTKKSIEIFHKVVAKETKYSIAKKYEVSIESLEKLNPEIVNNLLVGITLKIPTEKLAKSEITNVAVKTDNQLSNEKTAQENLINKIINRAQDQLNVKYLSGGNDSKGFDCSGLITYSFEKSGIQLPRTALEQSASGKIIKIEDAKIGDLIFFGTNGVAQINHVGLITEVNFKEIKFIHSSTRSGVIVSSTDEPYYKKDFVQINRIIE